MSRQERTDRQWEPLAPLRPPERPATGRPSRDQRTILNGLRWKRRTGAPWRDVPERDGPWATLYSRFRRWRLAGGWDRLVAAVQARAAAAGEWAWSVHVVDGTIVRAHQPAAGANGGTPLRRHAAAVGAGARRRSRSGWKAAASC